MANSSIWLHSGKLVDVLNIEATKFDIYDFAHALAQINRYTGNTVRPYSVSEHSTKGSLNQEVIDAGLARAFLIHDCSEVLVNDVPRPVKRQIPEYEAIEEDIQKWIFQCFNEPWENMEKLAKYDRRMCQDEMMQIFAMAHDIGLESMGVTVDFWKPEVAEFYYMERAKELNLV
jgi:uncharacterized protein